MLEVSREAIHQLGLLSIQKCSYTDELFVSRLIILLLMVRQARAIYYLQILKYGLRIRGEQGVTESPVDKESRMLLNVFFLIRCFFLMKCLQISQTDHFTETVRFHKLYESFTIVIQIHFPTALQFFFFYNCLGEGTAARRN